MPVDKYLALQQSAVDFSWHGDRYSELLMLSTNADQKEDALISLDSVEDAIPYYRDIIKMEPLGWVTIAPGEDGYAFQFTIAGALLLLRKTNKYLCLPKEN